MPPKSDEISPKNTQQTTLHAPLSRVGGWETNVKSSWEPFLKQQPFWAFAKTALCRIITLTRLLTQHLRHCSFCLRGAYYVASLTQLAYASLRNSGFRLRKPLTPSTHTKGVLDFGRCSLYQKTAGNSETNVDNRRENLFWSNSDLPQSTAGDKCREEQLGEPSKEPFRRRRPKKPRRQTHQFGPNYGSHSGNKFDWCENNCLNESRSWPLHLTQRV